MKKLRAAAATTLGIALALAGCGLGGRGSSAGQNTSATAGGTGGAGLTVWVDPAHQPVLQSAADRFTAATGARVVVEAHETSKIESDFLAKIDGSQGPDVIIGAGDRTGELVAKKAIAPIDLSTKRDSFQDVAVKALTYNGKVYGVPYALENVALIRNTELAPQAPTKFDDLLRNGEQLVKDGKADAVFAAGDPKPNAADSYHLFPLQASFGAPVFSQNSDGSYDPTRIAMNNDGGSKFAVYLAQLAKNKDYDMNMTGDIALQKFRSGRLPYFITGPWNMADIKKAGVKYSIEAVPSAGGQPATPFVTAQAFYVSSKSTRPADAQRFVVDYLTTQQVQTDLFKIGNRAPAQKEAFTAAQSDADVAAFGKIALTGVPIPNVVPMSLVWSDWGATEATLLKGESRDPSADWKAMCEAISGKIK